MVSNELTRVPLSAQVAERLLSEILDGSYSPGSSLPSEVALVSRFGVSRVVIREAIRALEARGLVEASQGKRPVVLGLTSSMPNDFFGMVLRADDRATLDRLPVLVVEVLSPSTRGRDQIDKRRLYARRGIASYWLVDPKHPSLRILELGTNGEYVEVANAVGDEPVEIVHPFPVRLVPGELLR